MADVRQTKLGQLFPQSVFIIPPYQRGYSWGEQQVGDLLQDLDYAFSERETTEDFTHYFGTIVLLDKGTKSTGGKNFDSFEVIDGQQRLTTISILISQLNKQLDSIPEKQLDEEYALSPADLSIDNREEFLIKYGAERVTLDDINKEAFRKLVIQNVDTSKIDLENVSQRSLHEAISTINEWFENKKEQFKQDGSLQHDEYYSYLRDLGKVVKNGLEITAYIIQDETEAGRLFEVVNDRGKDLTSLDKIKSYLVYCAARLDDRELSQKIYYQIGEVIRNVTQYGGTDSDIESFVSHHWRLFSGELVLARQRDSDYTEVHRRIKHLSKHADLSQDEEDLKTWINSYLDSIVECSEAYKVINYPDSIAVQNTDYSQETIERLDGIIRLPVSSNFMAVLMATHRRYGPGKEFEQITKLCEILSFRVYNIAGRRTDAGRVSIQRHGYWIEWAGKRDLANKVFENNPSALEFDTKSEAIPKTCETFESEIAENCHDDYFADCLLRQDIFDGSDRNDGWRGVRNKEVVRYLLYRYEKHLRDSGSKSNISQIPLFSKWKKEGITIEHIHPQTSDNDELNEVVDMIGNFCLLGPEDNSSASNGSYSDKYEKVYSKSSMLSIRALPDPSSGWSKSDIEKRTNDIIKFALSEWGGLSQAHVHINQHPKGMKDSQLGEVSQAVRKHYKSKSKTKFNIPSVHIEKNNVTLSDGWERVNSCGRCDSTQVDLLSLNGWDAQCAGCGKILKEPVYKFKPSSNVKIKSEEISADVS